MFTPSSSRASQKDRVVPVVSSRALSSKVFVTDYRPKRYAADNCPDGRGDGGGLQLPG